MGVIRLDFTRARVRPRAACIQTLASGMEAGAVPPVRARWRRGVAVAALVGIALVPRLMHLSASGFSEDELEKFEATTAYARHQFTVDADHPMLMKLGAFAAIRANARIERTSGRLTVADETLVRLPSAIAGAATTVVIYLLAASFFDPVIGVVAAAVWAFDVNAIAINRIAKEDSLLLLFLALAAWLYERGKAVGTVDPERAQHWFQASGAAWGLMMASKYMPYYLGIHTIFFRLAVPHAGPNRARLVPFFAVMAAAFAIANFAIFSPDTWPQILGFLGEQRLTHTGYYFDGRIWSNRVSATPFGLPLHFYVLALVTKTPLVWLGAALVGFVVLLRQPRSRGSLFVLVFLTLTLLPYSIVASKFLRYLAPVHFVLDMTIAVGIVTLARSIARRATSLRPLLVAAVSVVCVLPGVAAWHAHESHPGLFRNALGTRHSPDRLVFPHDELYDAGVREAAQSIAAEARPAAVAYSDAPRVLSHYLVRAGRTDVSVRPLSSPEATSGTEQWSVVQDGRRYFESQARVGRLDREQPATTITIDGVVAARVYRHSGEVVADRGSAGAEARSEAWPRRLR